MILSLTLEDSSAIASHIEYDVPSVFASTSPSGSCIEAESSSLMASLELYCSTKSSWSSIIVPSEFSTSPDI